MRGTIKENAADRWNVSELLQEVEITKKLIERVDAYNSNGYVVIYDGFGLYDSYVGSDYQGDGSYIRIGALPKNGDIAIKFNIPGEKPVKFDSITLAIGDTAGSDELDIFLVPDKPNGLYGEPDESTVLEHLKLRDKIEFPGKISQLRSVNNPILNPRGNYWFIFSVPNPKPESQLELKPAPIDFMPRPSLEVKRYKDLNQGQWRIGESQSGPGYAVRIIGRLI